MTDPASDATVFTLGVTPWVRERFFRPEHLERLREAGTVTDPDTIADFSDPQTFEALARTEVLLTGWGTPFLDAEALRRMPNLRAVMHTAGTVKNVVTDACWERGIRVTNAADANAVPVAEYTLATILYAGKKVLPVSAELHRRRGETVPDELFPRMGNYGKTVGIVGASRIGRHVIELLRPFSFEVLCYDPFLSADEARRLGVEAVELDELVSRSDIVTVHAPEIPQTHHMIDRRMLSLMRPGSTLINTARGSLIDQEALVDRLRHGDVDAVLDVTSPWVLESDHPLYDLPNVMLTPHMAGSLGTEWERLADSAVDEAIRFARGAELRHEVHRADLSTSA